MKERAGRFFSLFLYVIAVAWLSVFSVSLFNSPEPLAHGELLLSLDVHRSPCVIRHVSSTIALKDIFS